MLAFQSDAEAAGAVVVLRTPVLSGRVRDDGFDLAIGGEEADRHPLSLPRQCSWALCARRETPPGEPTPQKRQNRVLTDASGGIISPTVPPPMGPVRGGVHRC